MSQPELQARGVQPLRMGAEDIRPLRKNVDGAREGETGRRVQGIGTYINMSCSQVP